MSALKQTINHRLRSDRDELFDCSKMKRFVSRTSLVVVFVLVGAMWVYALFFASKEVVNEIGDRAWTSRAESICNDAKLERIALADFRPIDQAGKDALADRAKIVDLATDTLDRMLVKIESSQPTDLKGQAIIPLWLTDYHTYIADRRQYANQLRSGSNVPFGETMLMGIPLSEKLATFAADNAMTSCKPPIDLSV